MASNTRALRTPTMRAVQGLAAVLTFAGYLIATVVSYGELTHLARMAHFGLSYPQTLPLLLDGGITMSTVGYVATKQKYFRNMLLATLGTSLLGNVFGIILHSVPVWLSAMISTIAPIMIITTTHGLVVLFGTVVKAAAPAPVTKSKTATAPAKPRKTVAVGTRSEKIAKAQRLHADGRTTAEIAATLGVSPRTVQDYLRDGAKAVPTAAAVTAAPVLTSAPVPVDAEIDEPEPVDPNQLPLALVG